MLLLLAACAVDNGESPPAAEAPKAGNCANCKQFFSIKKLSLTHVDGSEVLLRLSADSVVGRPRMGRLVTFDNYDEIYLRQLIIDQPLKGGVAQLDLHSIAQAFKSFDDGNADGQGEPASAAAPEAAGKPAEEPTSGLESELTKHSMSRLLADEIRINIKPGRRRPIVLTASHAKMAADGAIIRFERNVALNAAHCGLSAPLAIWSSEHSGLFLPESYRLNGKNHGPGGFYHITRAGRCVRIKPAPAVEYVDMLDTVENQLFQSLPLPIRLLFGFSGGPAASAP